MAIPSKRLPRSGEIWFVKFHARNQHERADTVLAIPLTTSIHKEVPTHILITSAETGLSSDSAARAAFATPADRQRAYLPAWAGHSGSARLRSVRKAFSG